MKKYIYIIFNIILTYITVTMTIETLTCWSEKGVVIMLMKKMQKLIAALVLVGFLGSAGLPIMAEASSYHSENGQEQKNYFQKEAQRIQRQKEEQRLQKQREEQRIQRQQEEKRLQQQREEQRIQRQREEQRIQRQREEMRRQHRKYEQHRHYGNNNSEQHVGEGD